MKARLPLLALGAAAAIVVLALLRSAREDDVPASGTADLPSRPAEAPRTPGENPERPAPRLDVSRSTLDSVTGRVLDVAGEPIRGAEILRAGAANDSDDVRVASSGADGTFSLQPDDPSPAEYAIRADGFFPLRGLYASPGDRIDVALDRGATARGRVADARSGEGIGGALVRIEGRDVLRTDDRGRFSWVTARRTHSIRIQAPNYAAAVYWEIDAPRDGAVAEFLLWPESAGPAVFLRVVDDATGDAVAPVRADGAAAPPVGTSGLVRSPHGARPTAGIAAVSAAGHVARGVHHPAASELAADLTIDVRLRKGVAAAGRVVDPDGSPIGGVRVTSFFPEIRRPEFSLSREVWTAEALSGDNGRFRLDGLLPRESASIAFEHPAHVRQAIDVALPADGAIEMPDVVLARGAAIEGVVRRASDGRGVGGALVRWISASNERRETSTNSAGSFRFDGLSGTGALAVWAIGLAPRVLDGILAEAPPHIDVSLDDGLAIEGEVVFEDARPGRGASVRAYVQGMTESRFPPPTEAFALNQASCDESGRFRIAGLTAGRYLLHAWLGSKRAQSGENLVEPGASGIVLRLEEDPLATGIRLRVVSARDGEPLPRVRVDVFAEDEAGVVRSVPGVTSGSGEYWAALEPSRPSRIRLAADGFLGAESGPWEMGEGEVRNVSVALEPGARIQGRVIDGEGAPVPGVWLHFSSEAGVRTAGRPGTPTDENGLTFVGGLDAGPHRVTATRTIAGAEGRETTSTVRLEPEIVDVARGRDAIVDFAIVASGTTVEGRIEIEGEDRSGSLLLTLSGVSRDGARVLRQCRTSTESGRLSFGDVEPGDYAIGVEIEIETGDREILRKTLVVEPANIAVPPVPVVTIDLRAKG